MGDYLSREALLKSGVETTDVEAFGGTVRVREMSAALIDALFRDGIIVMEEAEDGQGEHSVKMDIAKMDWVRTAQQVIVTEDDSTKTLLTRGDLDKLKLKAFGDIQRCVLASIDISDLGQVDEDQAEDVEADSGN